MILQKTSIRRVVLLGAFAIITRLATAQTPSPALLVVNTGIGSENVHEGEHSLAIVDPLTNKLVGRVPIGRHPHEVAVSADGKLAFVTSNSSSRDPKQIPDDTISVIDLAARKELRLVEVGPGSWPHGIVFAGGKVYFTAEGYKLVGRYDPTSNRIDWMVGTGQNRMHYLVITKDTKKIFTASTGTVGRGSDTVAAIESWDPVADFETFPNGPPPLWNVTVIPVGRGPEGIAMSPDEKEVWTLNRGDGGGVSIIDVGTKKVSQTLSLKTKNPLRLKFTPDGKRVLIGGGDNGELLVIDTVTRKEIKRIRVASILPGELHGILIVPDGSRAYVAVKGGNNDVAIIDLKTLEVTGRISTGDAAEGMAWAETR